jgi:hypothetical protein
MKNDCDVHILTYRKVEKHIKGPFSCEASLSDWQYEPQALCGPTIMGGMSFITEEELPDSMLPPTCMGCILIHFQEEAERAA